MANDPSYVRLANRLSLQVIADISEFGSGWSISGLDVKEFPEDTEAARYVRLKVGQGVLETATRAEFEEVQDDEEAANVVARFSDPNAPMPWQEADVQEVHARKRRQLEANRTSESDEEEEEWEGQRRYEELLEEQDELNLNTDDAEEQTNRTARGGARAVKAQKSAKKASKRPSQEDTQPIG